MSILTQLIYFSLLVSVNFPWNFMLLSFVLSFFSVGNFLLILVILILAVDGYLIRVFVLELVDEFIGVIDVFLSLFFLSHSHELHGVEAFRLFFLPVIVRLFHFLKLLLKVHDSLLSVVFIIIFFGEISKNLFIDLVFLQLFLTDLIDLIDCILDGIFIVLVETQ